MALIYGVLMIITGDCLEVMKTFPENHFSSILTDPPYGLKFMGKEWDHSVPGIPFWKEALRICKPGTMMLCFGGTRTYHRLACAIEDAGWEIRDCLQWIYGSGFPKSHNKFGLEGYGTALKPAYEPILLCMKPLEGTYAQNVEKWGLGGINIDGCRILSHENLCRPSIKQNDNKILGKGLGAGIQIAPKGRWPANILFDEEAAKMLDEHAGILKSGSIEPHHKFKLEKKVAFGQYNAKSGITQKGDSGGASRFFYCAKASSAERNNGCEGLPLKDSVYAKNAENGEGLRVSDSKLPKQNFHPTVKPLKLLEYLLKLISPPKNALILDPFAGSGSTCVSAKQLGIECIGIEINPEYCEIARKRVDTVKSEVQLELNFDINNSSV